jgi:hypothetical protein
MIELRDLLPAAEQGWLTLCEITEETDSDWVLVGGQMIFLLAEEHGAQLPRPTDDMDIVVDVRARPGGTAWLSTWLMDRDFKQGDISADGISHRFTRVIGAGLGTLIFDVLAPDGLGAAADLTTRTPGRTIQTPGGTQALGRREVTDIQVHCSNGEVVGGRVCRPDLLGALVMKAAATSELTVRTNPERDWQDCALLLSMVEDPIAMSQLLNPKDRSRLRRLEPLRARTHHGWILLSDEHHRRGIAALDFLTE